MNDAVGESHAPVGGEPFHPVAAVADMSKRLRLLPGTSDRGSNSIGYLVHKPEIEMQRRLWRLIQQELSVDVGDRRIVLVNCLNGNVRNGNLGRRRKLISELVIGARLKQAPIDRAQNVSTLPVVKNDPLCKERVVD